MPDRRQMRWMRVRLLVVVGLLGLATAGLVWRFWTLQVSQADWLRGLAQDQYLKEITLEPMRGPILDRHGAPLAVSVMTESIFVMPQEVQDLPGTAAALAKTLGLDARALERKLAGRRQFTWVKRRIPAAEAEAVQALGLPGVHATAESRRYYPARELAASVVGFAGDGRGLEGLELLFDGQLRGSTVLAQGLRDARGNVLFAEAAGADTASEGTGLTLTLDLTLQELTEAELERAVRESEARAGSAVVLEPHSGEILALANWPGFNPNTFAKVPRERFRNRAVTDCFEPGSTLKVFSLAAAMQANALRLDETFDCQGGALTIGRHTIHDSGGHRLRVASVRDILVQSSNVGMARIGLRLGRERLWQGLDAFGFGRRTGVDLPGESGCRLRRPGSWSEVGLANISFGQGVSATPLQLAAALGAVANGGVWLRPLIVKEIRAPRGRLVQAFQPDPAGRVLEERWARALANMMVGVTEPGGTGTRAALAGFRVAGKTGTAQKPDAIAGGYSDKRVASFMGFVPAEAPRVAILVLIDEPQTSPYGGVVAAPAFARIAEGALAYLGVFPAQAAVADARPALQASPRQDEEAVALDEEPVEAAPVGSAAGRMPDVRGLSARESLQRLSARGIEVALLGSGRVARQEPAPGTPLVAPARVRLLLERGADAGGEGGGGRPTWRLK
ncbi:MAG TPA: penicillin-binding protein [Myxococcota bacterium]|nr:penicillin-binding protein [Myxococcota bacterium]HRY91898.1 penicillin-binding protein [Myxococcota bacterium]HSA22514.1 penicillin-binding protein [Myxococcota bacterium]